MTLALGLLLAAAVPMDFAVDHTGRSVVRAAVAADGSGVIAFQSGVSRRRRVRVAGFDARGQVSRPRVVARGAPDGPRSARGRPWRRRGRRVVPASGGRALATRGGRARPGRRRVRLAEDRVAAAARAVLHRRCCRGRGSGRCCPRLALDAPAGGVDGAARGGRAVSPVAAVGARVERCPSGRDRRRRDRGGHLQLPAGSVASRRRVAPAPGAKRRAFRCRRDRQPRGRCDARQRDRDARGPHERGLDRADRRAGARVRGRTADAAVCRRRAGSGRRRFVYLSRTIGTWSQVEQWFTPDEGRTWTTRQLTVRPDGFCARPVTPRGLRDADRVLYWTGDKRTTGWTKFVTRIHALDF